jgi:hypothetical protein
MAATRTYLNYITKHIDIAPANSQEELDAATMIQTLMSEHNLAVSQQDVATPALGTLIHDALLLLMFVAVLLSGFVGTVVGHIGVLLCIVCAVIIFCERAGIHVVSTLGPVAQSQNIIGFHKGSGPLCIKGVRPIVIVAHYDTPREEVLTQLQLAPYAARLKKLVPMSCIVAIVCVIMQISFLAFIPDAVRRVFWLLGVLCAIPMLAVGVNTVYKKFSVCTEGANSNKASLAAMLSIIDTLKPGNDSAKQWQTGVGGAAGTAAGTAGANMEVVSAAEDEGLAERGKAADAEVEAAAAVAANATTAVKVDGEAVAEASANDHAQNKDDADADDVLAASANEQDASTVTDAESTDDSAATKAVEAVEAVTGGDALEAANVTDVVNAANTAAGAAAGDNAPACLNAHDVARMHEFTYEVAEGSIRRGKDALLALGLLPETCSVSYDVDIKPLHPELFVEPALPEERMPLTTLTPKDAMETTQSDEAIDPDAMKISETLRAARARRTRAVVMMSYEEQFPEAAWEPCDESELPGGGAKTAATAGVADAAAGAQAGAHGTHAAKDEDKAALGAADVPSPDKTQAYSPAQIIETKTAEVDAPAADGSDAAARATNAAHKGLSAAAVQEAFDKERQTVLDESNTMARRAALFDLPNPMEVPHDPFATGASEPLSSSDDAAAGDAADNAVDAADNADAAKRGTWKGGATTRKGLRVIEGGKNPGAMQHDADAELLSNNNNPGMPGADAPADAPVDAARSGAFRVVEGGARANDEHGSGTAFASTNEQNGHNAKAPAAGDGLSLKNNPFVKDGVVELFQTPAAADVTGIGARDAATPAAPVNAAEVLQEAADNHPENFAEQKELDAKAKDARDHTDEVDAVLSMGNDELRCHDIWFVAAGASELGCAGMHAFLRDHKRDIRGCFLINLDAVGAGSLSILSREGLDDTRACDRRISRLCKRVAENLHIELDEAPYDYAQTDATEAMRSSVRSLTLMGLDANGLPAFRGTNEDVAENIDDKQVKQVAQLVSEVIRRA